MKWGIERSKTMTQLSTLPVAGHTIQRQYDRFLRLKFKANWDWLRNPQSRRAFRSTCPTLSQLQQRLVAELLETGVAICQFDELFQDPQLWNQLSAYVSDFTSSDSVQSVIKKHQQGSGSAKDLAAAGHYIVTYYDQSKKPMISADNLLLKLSLNRLIIDVVNTYLSLRSKLIYFDMWYTLPLNDDTRILSQRWHRDPEDRRKIRTFLYFNQIDQSNGAMEYLLGSHVGGPYEQVFPWSDPLEMPYPPQEEIARVIPSKQHTILQGPPGTLVFCDTAGLHRGGTTKTRPRILATAAYVTPASLHRRRFEIDASVRASFPKGAERFAII